MDYDKVDLIVTSRFGGISSCDIFIHGLVDALRERHAQGRRTVPVFGRMVGTDLPSARDYLEKARAETPESLKDSTIIVGNQRIMADVIRDAISSTFATVGGK
jgi:succinyl-CoA synthetase beta subunit